MKHVDYIVVGLGIAGVSFCEQLKKHNKSFIVVDNNEEGSTAKSGGVFNPTVLKRFTAAWNASAFYPAARSFYKEVSEKISCNIFRETPILRILKSVAEQNNWSVATDKKELQQFLASEFIKNTNPAIDAPYGFGAVLGTGQIDAHRLLAGYRDYLASENLLLSENFEYHLLQEKNNAVVYKDISAAKIIFSEGAKAVQNPFFPKHAITGNKGEYIVIKAPELKMDNLLKGPVYVIPLGNDTYKVGATYSRDDYSLNPTQEAKEQILTKLRTITQSSFQVVAHTAGVRPTTRDHRPLLGAWEESSNIVFFNGLGSRGFLMAPLLAEILYRHVTENVSLSKEMDIKRTRNWK
ncbi:NAD(P)/FAD-dependent oxidoreductase [Aequorivita marina]|uniref:NAD(P)/FAD-dependent oxidoreductase n=1 Tax=Aequorivita marina TaxID=3073654 RepID=UPI0028762EC9|nr:FAD-dependent oxidoreductase [Aequorivita sp. S2608]MDS1298490.1 FAD-dependent oxidoreductase [Aequorivita sp. S2608]